MKGFGTLGRTVLGSWMAILLLAPSAGASPLELSNPAPRWVAVAFEISPAEHPTRRRARFTPRLPARLEPADRAGQVRIRLAGHLVERFLLAGEDPTPGSFGDFTWIFDPETGHVVSAELEGALRKQMGWGFAAWDTEARIRVHMSTHAPVAFETRNVLGEAVHSLCEGTPRPDCTRVDPSVFDPTSGYVNAVGRLSADSGPLHVDSFSPLGEAVFSEVDGAHKEFWTHGLEAVVRADVAAPPPASGFRR